MITQNEMRRLKSLREQISQLQVEEASLRSKVLRKHDDFGDVEDGSLSLKVSLRKSMVFSRSALLDAIGRSEFRKLKEKVQPTTYETVKIVKARRGKTEKRKPETVDEDWDLC